MEREKATFTKFAISLHLIWRVQWFKSVLQKYKKILNGITNGISCMSCLDNTNKNISLPSSTAFLMEIIHSVVGTYLFNFQPLLTRTEVHVILLLWFLSFIPFWFSLFFLLLFLPCSNSKPNTQTTSLAVSQGQQNMQTLHRLLFLQVYKTGVTHYFSIKKARQHLQYKPSEHSLDSVVKYFKDRGHGKYCKRPSNLRYYFLNIMIGLMCVCLLLEWLPMVKSLVLWSPDVDVSETSVTKTRFCKTLIPCMPKSSCNWCGPRNRFTRIVFVYIRGRHELSCSK